METVRYIAATPFTGLMPPGRWSQMAGRDLAPRGSRSIIRAREEVVPDFGKENLGPVQAARTCLPCPASVESDFRINECVMGGRLSALSHVPPIAPRPSCSAPGVLLRPQGASPVELRALCWSSPDRRCRVRQFPSGGTPTVGPLSRSAAQTPGPGTTARHSGPGPHPGSAGATERCPRSPRRRVAGF